MNIFLCSEKKSFLLPNTRQRTVIKNPPRALHFRSSLGSVNLIKNEIFVLANSYPTRITTKTKSRPLSTVQTTRKTANLRSPSLFSSVFSTRRESLSVHRRSKLDCEEEIESFKADCISYFTGRK